MNKKGFTLVELLAVIAILAILVLVAVPNVLGMFNNAKKDTFATETKDMIRIAQQQYLANFGKYTNYAIKDSKVSEAADAASVTTVDCENNPADYTSSKYCIISKDAGNLTSFYVEFNDTDGAVKKVFSYDKTYKYTFTKTDGKEFNAQDVVAQ